MKSKLLLLSFLMLLTVATNYAQSSASQAGIAVQGIARNNNNTARISEVITLNFRIYHGANILIYEIAKMVTTDSFGVFSVVLEPGATNNILMTNNQAFLRISEGTTIISDEILRQVPYAIAAANGVPTGSIMPYIGTTAPDGWLLCDGLTNVPQPSALYNLIGSTTPNLRGMFLRGTGTSPVNSEAGPALKTMQGDELKSHNHATTENPHTHNYDDIYFAESTGQIALPNSLGANGSDRDNKGFEISRTSAAARTGLTINNNGGTETRPVNYGVNYIIKL